MLDDHPIADRLADDLIIWMTTVTASGNPQSSPVWFLREGEELLVFSLDSARVRNLTLNPRVALNLNSDRHGGHVTTMEGTARVVDDAPPADEHEVYVTKYFESMKSLGWTPADFASRYATAIRITVDRIRAW